MELGTVLPSVQRILSARSRAEASRDDKVSGFRGRLYGMTVFFCFALSSCFWPSSRSWFWSWPRTKNRSLLWNEEQFFLLNGQQWKRMKQSFCVSWAIVS